MTEFRMPSLGADMTDGTLIGWMKKPGDVVKRGDMIAEVDTDKGVIEVEVFENAVIEELLVQDGEKVPVGTVLAIINVACEKHGSVPQGVSVTPLAEAIRPDQPAPSAAAKVSEPRRIHASPAAKKLAEELGVDLGNVDGTGPGGRICKSHGISKA